MLRLLPEWQWGRAASKWHNLHVNYKLLDIIYENLLSLFLIC